MRALVFGLLMLSAVPAAAEEIAVYGAGNMPCSGFLYAENTSGQINNVMRESAESWFLGYVSAVNWSELHLSPNGPLTAKAMFDWVKGYCLKYPDDRLNIAALALVANSKPK